MSDKSLLDMAPSVEVQMQINVGGLDIVMAQMVLDVRDGMATIVHVNCPAVTKAMDRIDVFETFRRKGLFEILFADAVNAMAGQFFTALVDKKPVLIRRLRGDAVFSDIELEEMASFWLELYKPEPIPFSQDRHSFVPGVEVVQIQRGHFGGPGAGIIEQMKEGIIPEPLFCLQVNGLENLQDLILIKKTDERLLCPLLGDTENGICHHLLFGIHKADHFGKGLEGRKPLIAGLDQILSLTLKVFKECND